jgi:hypothetical protein
MARIFWLRPARGTRRTSCLTRYRRGLLGADLPLSMTVNLHLSVSVQQTHQEHSVIRPTQRTCRRSCDDLSLGRPEPHPDLVGSWYAVAVLNSLTIWLKTHTLLYPFILFLVSAKHGLRVDGTHEHAPNGTQQGNQLALPANYSRNKSSRCSRRRQLPLLPEKCWSRAGTLAESARATARIRGIGRRWRCW